MRSVWVTLQYYEVSAIRGQSVAKRIVVECVKLSAMVKAAHEISNGAAGPRSIAHMVSGLGTPLSR